MSTNDNNNEQGDWKAKINGLVQSAQSELKKTTKIGMKMLSASQSNSDLHEIYEKIGVILKNAIESKELDWDHPEVNELISAASKLEKDLQSLETDVQDIKKG